MGSEEHPNEDLPEDRRLAETLDEFAGCKRCKQRHADDQKHLSFDHRLTYPIGQSVDVRETHNPFAASRPQTFEACDRPVCMSYNDSGYRTTIGWSLLSSGIVTLILKVMPFDSLWWGLLLIVAGIAVMLYR